MYKLKIWGEMLNNHKQCHNAINYFHAKYRAITFSFDFGVKKKVMSIREHQITPQHCQKQMDLEGGIESITEGCAQLREQHCSPLT